MIVGIPTWAYLFVFVCLLVGFFFATTCFLDLVVEIWAELNQNLHALLRICLRRSSDWNSGYASQSNRLKKEC